METSLKILSCLVVASHFGLTSCHKAPVSLAKNEQSSSIFASDFFVHSQYERSGVVSTATVESQAIDDISRKTVVTFEDIDVNTQATTSRFFAFKTTARGVVAVLYHGDPSLALAVQKMKDAGNNTPGDPPDAADPMQTASQDWFADLTTNEVTYPDLEASPALIDLVKVFELLHDELKLYPGSEFAALADAVEQLSIGCGCSRTTVGHSGVLETIATELVGPDRMIEDFSGLSSKYPIQLEGTSWNVTVRGYEDWAAVIVEKPGYPILFIATAPEKGNAPA